MDQINVGDIYRATAEFRVAGVLTDPTAVTARSLAPDGTEAAVTATKSSTGVYYADIPVTASGVWRFWFTGTGAAAGVEAGAFTAYALPHTEPRYVTPDVLRNRLAPDGDTTNATAASLSDADLARAVATAEATVNGRLADRYQVPFTTPFPLLVIEIVADIAAYDATLTHRRGNPLPERDPVQLRYTAAHALLKEIASGEVDLPGAAAGGTDATVSTEPVVVNAYDGSMFVLSDFGLLDPWT